MRTNLGVLLLFPLVLLGQKRTGELQIITLDGSGSPLEAHIEVVGEATGVRLGVSTDGSGAFNVRPLPFGIYSVRASRQGFQTRQEIVEIVSEVPAALRLTLGVAPVETTLLVREQDTLLDPHRTSAAFYVGAERVSEQHAAQRSRDVLEMVNAQPGWLLEANGVLHPRGSEYNTQYVIDGVPITDNRSPGFAPALDLDDVESLNVLTAGYPAEYGRKLGGVVEVVSNRTYQPGRHGKVAMDAGSFRSRSGAAVIQQRRGKTTVSLAGSLGSTRRFLDPPVEENLSNSATGGGYAARLERDFTERDRLSVYLHGKRAAFLAPNEAEQEEAGQRQDRRNVETLGHASYQRVLSPDWVIQARAMSRDLSANLWSNSLATPMFAESDRGFREGYFAGSVAANWRRHSIKFGAESILTRLYEGFRYRITDRAFFADDLPGQFEFAGRNSGHEMGLFVQDTVRLGRLTLSLGLRFDRYSILTKDHAWSPRLGAGYHFPRLGLRLHASYDRAFETPAVEGLLVASSPLLRKLTDETSGLALQPTRSHFYQTGFAKSLWGKMRLDANYYRRRSRNFADDALLLNTGVSFPVTFDRADIHGVEAKLELPRWRALSGSVSYSNMTGTGYLPLTGGLFLEEEAAEQLLSTASFPVTQDQRNTLRTRWRYQIHPRFWAASSASYNSGLPFEREGGELEMDELEERFGARILDRVDFERGRVKPQFSLDFTAGCTLHSGEGERVTIQADAWNVTGRLNLVNFSGIFSGTAVAAPRSAAVRLSWEF